MSFHGWSRFVLRFYLRHWVQTLSHANDKYITTLIKTLFISPIGIYLLEVHILKSSFILGPASLSVQNHCFISTAPDGTIHNVTHQRSRSIYKKNTGIKSLMWDKRTWDSYSTALCWLGLYKTKVYPYADELLNHSLQTLTDDGVR